MRDQVSTTAPDEPGRSDGRVGRLMLLFAALYFIQGISEPTEGLVSQPTRSLLRNWGYGTAEVSSFMAMLALPWSIKPLYGLLTDFVPIAGSRRRSWLLITTFVSSIGLVALYFFPLAHGAATLLFAGLILPTIGVAFSDVVVDALMVEESQPRGLTGRIQSVQWSAIYAATILTGLLGGYLSQYQRQELGYLIAGIATFIGFVLVLLVVREPRRAEAADDTSQSGRRGMRHALLAMWRTVRHPGILTIGAFIFLWNFNPFTSSVLYMHMVEHMGFSEAFFGRTVAIVSVGCMIASAAYGYYCRRLSVTQLVLLSIVTGVLATLAYWALWGEWSAAIISFFVGFTYMTGMLIQLDLAARVCEIETAGTTFALLMSLANLSVSISMYLGGQIYDAVAEGTSYTFAFNTVVVIGALFTCCCLLLVPAIRRYCPPNETSENSMP